MCTALAGTAAVSALVVWPGGRPPVGVIVAVFLVAAVGAPASQIGFHLARDYNPAGSMSTATGVVNAGGFIGAMIASVTIGIVLDAVGGPDLVAYRWAMGALAAFSALTTLTMAVSLMGVRRRLLARIAAGEPTILPVYEHLWDRAFRRLTARSDPPEER